MSRSNVGQERILKLLVLLLQRPGRYTKAELAEYFGRDERTIYRDVKLLRQVGFEVSEVDGRYRLIENKQLEKLDRLLHFSAADRDYLRSVLEKHYPNSDQNHRILRRLERFYDFDRLGYQKLRRPYLAKIDALQKAQDEQRVAVLRGYRSTSSNRVADRRVEPFHLMPEHDLVQTFDLDAGGLRHFRLSRFGRVELTDERWQHENQHRIQLADPFHIVSDAQEWVRVRLTVGGYNELVERFPLTEQHILPDAEPGIYEFAAKVNAQFWGLSNFLMGNFHHVVEVGEPAGLRRLLVAQANEMNKKLNFFD